jgi:outer membrane receptor protein involved in Fe transport
MKKLSFLLLVLVTNVALSQNVITGVVVDSNQTQLPSANVMIAGTKKGTTTGFNGRFTLRTEKQSGNLKVSYIGFKPKTVPFDFSNSDNLELGQVVLENDANSLNEIVIIGKGVTDLEQDRQTPIAVSTITREQIQQRAVGNVEFSEIIKNTPSVYVSNQAGGFGDSQIFIRGFDQSNTAYLLNGQPINGMEDGNMYWSNWSGLADIANAVQVQRGLGSSKLAISSVGGTVNIVTKATNRTEGGFARFLVGNGSYLKGTVSYDTGLNDNGWGFSFLLDYWQAHSKYADGTKGQGQNYFFSVGKVAGDHNFNFLLTGAPQRHDQNFSKDRELFDRYGRKYNNNYGFKDGEYLTSRRNYYHKPVMNLNWDWATSDKSNLSTVAYASFGRGGGTGTYGNGVGFIDYNKAPEDPIQGGAYRPSNGLIDWDYIQNVSNAQVEGGFSQGFDGTLLRASVNNHQWYGMVSNFEYNGIKNLSLNFGGDLRFYRGDHFRQLTDKLGLKGRIEDFGGNPNNTVTETYSPDPWSALFDYAPEEDRVNYDYSENINYQGGFGQAEYAIEKFSVFLQGSFSNQSYKREDRGNFEGTKESKTVNKLGYNFKTGAAFTFAEDNTVFVNTGQYSRQPFLDNIFPSFSDNTQLADPEVENEEIFGLEAGYRFETGDWQVNLNAYYTKWDNRFLNQGGEYDPNPDGDGIPEFEQVSYLYSDISQLHQGLELDVKWRPMIGLQLRGYATVANWEYDGSSPVRIRDNNTNSFIETLNVQLDGTKIGQAPQTTAGLGVDYDVIANKLKTYITWNYNTDFYGVANPSDAASAGLEGETYQPEKLNSYSLFDLGASYNLKFQDQRFQIAANVYNVLDHEYISQKDNFGYYIGNGTTYNFSIKYLF